MSEDLERILAQFLKVNRYECCYSIYKDEKEKNEMEEKYLNQHKTHADWNLSCMVNYMCNRFHKQTELEKKKKQLENELKNVQHGKQPSELKTEEKIITRDKNTIAKDLETITKTL
eukprot:18384_1